MNENNIRQRCLAVMAELKGVGRDGFNQHHKYRFTPHDVISGLLHDLFVKHGIDQEVSVLAARRLDGSATLELEVEISWVNVDKPNERKTVRCYGHSTPAGRTKEGGYVAPDDLGVGKALSYAVKYAQLKNFTLTGDSTPDLEDDDKPAETAKPPVAVSEIEALLDGLMKAKNSDELSRIGDVATSYMDQLSADQQKILAAAWKAAKSRLSEAADARDTSPRGPTGTDTSATSSGTAAPVSAVDSVTVDALLGEYKQVRDAAQLAAARKRVGMILKFLSPAQTQILKEADAAANSLLLAQTEAARP